jgi:hypothetical protein
VDGVDFAVDVSARLGDEREKVFEHDEPRVRGRGAGYRRDKELTLYP